jgi:hypothetical protein
MRLPLGPEFRIEWQRYALRFCCEDCTYFCERDQRCIHGWPEEEHRLSFYLAPTCDELVFCKEFELR